MIRREFNASFISRIANSEAVRPFVHPLGHPMDFAPVFSHTEPSSGICFLSNGDDAVAVFELTAPRIWQAHTMFAATCRGRRAVDTGRAMVAYMFDQDLADVLWGTTPRSNSAARWFNRQIGAVLTGGDKDEEIFEIQALRRGLLRKTERTIMTAKA